MDDLDATAREFGLPADLIFQWLKENAESDRPIAPPPARSFRQAPRTTSSEKSKPAAREDWQEVASIYAVLLVPGLLLIAVGHVRPSLQAQRDCLPIWIVIGIALFALQVRYSNRRLDAQGVDLPAVRRLGIAVLYAALGAISTWILSLAIPAIPHRLIAKPLEVQCVGFRKANRGAQVRYRRMANEFEASVRRICRFADDTARTIGKSDSCCNIGHLSRTRGRRDRSNLAHNPRAAMRIDGHSSRLT